MTTQDSIGRRSRLRATSTGKRVSPTDRDMLWFLKLAEHGPLATSFLLAFSSRSHASDKRASERLADLFHEDNTPDGGTYLIRPPQQFRTIDSRYNQLVHDLAPAARRALERRMLGLRASAAPSGPWLHRFMTSSITASIELATLARDDVSYIPQSAVLARAGVDVRYPVTITDPSTGWCGPKDLIPDAVFGLRYQTREGDRFRFFAVEADRATEPTTSANWNRKSFERSLIQYDAYIAGRAYRDHLGLTAPLLVLNVLSDEARMARMVDFVAQRYPRGNSYMLFQTWADFGAVFRPPDPSPAFLNGGWVRGGLPEFSIDQP
ncbi:MAG: replication-relaxation family protein [Blastomonas sp.]|uniref:replication-relaxation family protein n=1 Tax=Blastomonas sp. TaxID=1909299 RepID=UPI0025846A5E|nr:replication-relaxation family protein [Blastomonas sp.]MCO5792817.1 replication-relaxation family protein [Blastomonas sp.]